MSSTRRGDQTYLAWVILAVIVLVSFATRGLRFGFGLFITPLVEEFGWGYSEVALSLSLFALISGLLQPLIGELVDRWGGGAIMTIGTLLMGAALALSSFVHDLWQLYLTLGVLAGIGFSGLTAVSTGAVLNAWFPERRGTALGISSAGVNTGQLLLGPLVGFLILSVGWRSSFLLIGIPLALVLAPIAWLGTRARYPQNPEPSGRSSPAGGGGDGLGGGVLRDAFRRDDFRRLALGLFGCGFLMQMIFTFLPTMVLLWGGTKALGGIAVGVLGGCAILGSMLSGTLSDRYPRRTVLALIYFARIPLVVLALSVHSLWALMVFAVGMGLMGFGTVGLTSALTADQFGTGSFGRVYAFIFLSHQVGAFLGTYLGGLALDLTGSFTIPLIAGMIISMGSGFLSLGLPAWSAGARVQASA
ncbi:MAG: MFS transporter [Firmicutes bacterium]|nr:MFS transporter [Bacillota bacterium]